MSLKVTGTANLRKTSKGYRIIIDMYLEGEGAGRCFRRSAEIPKEDYDEMMERSKGTGRLVVSGELELKAKD